MKIPRRRMLIRTAQAAAALALAAPSAVLSAERVKRRLRIGACEWSLGRDDPTCFDLARQIGLEGVQLSMGSLANHLWLRRPEVQRAYRSAAKRANLAISGLALAELNNIPLKNDPRAAVWLIDSIDVAVALGVKVILVAQFFHGDLKDDPAGIDRTVQVLQDVAPRAEKAGVILGLENYLSAEENLHILHRVGSPAVLVYYDVGNSTDKGYNIYDEIRLLKGKICEFHFKDDGFMLGQGRINFKLVHDAMNDIGFSGWVQIEAAAPLDLVKDYQADLAYLRRIFSYSSAS
ncbi:MAG: sugar phosphate isomerase/epimerase [Verrucomicrobia bacterium]|nr:sugar phosphate isomerase/epimerase [Verrucomicrobiota bacterium]